MARFNTLYRYMTNVDIVRKAQSSFLQSKRPDIRTGMEVEIHQKIKEGNKERIQRFKGIVIKTAGKSELEKTITVRRKIGAFGVEKIFAIHSPTIDKIDVLRQFKVRRKSIKFIRELTGKAARLKEVSWDKVALNTEKSLPVVEMPVEQLKAPVTEEVVAETPVEATKTSKEEIQQEVSSNTKVIGDKLAEKKTKNPKKEDETK